MAGHWQAQVSYQYGNATQFFVGDQRNDAAGPGGQAPHRKVSIFDVGILYGVSNRVSLDLTVPFLSGSVGFVQADHKFQTWNAGGLGDISPTLANRARATPRRRKSFLTQTSETRVHWNQSVR